MIVESMLERGELPNLARIRNSGSYSRLKTTYPAQTPVAWSSFATGTNSGGHGIFDLISRDPATYLGEGFAAVDWSRTYAYAVGLGGIYLNFKGREREGVVEEGTEAERVCQAIKTAWRESRIQRRSGRRCAACRAGKTFTPALTPPMLRICW
jgi:predicted AlkP superfamily phosphohydrolase/phosphomutase